MSKHRLTAHVLAPYIRTTETFMYDRIANHKNYDAFVMTDELPINTGQFPFKTIHSLGNRPLVERKLDTLLKKTSGFSLYYYRLLKKMSPSVVHAHYGPVGAAILPATKAAGKPLVVSFYGIDASAFLNNPAMMRTYKKMFAGADIISTLSSNMSDRLAHAGCPREKLRVHHLAVDVDAFSKLIQSPEPAHDGIFRVVSVGRMVPKKGMPHLLESFQILSAQHPDCELHIYGGGPLEKDVRKTISEKGLENIVSLHGHQDRNTVIKAIASASAFALFSTTGPDGDQEGTPTVLIEAGALAVPSVSTFHAGIPEIIDDKKTGLLANEKDVEGFAGHLLQLARNPEIRKQIGLAARNKIVAQFSIRSVIDEIEKTYDDIS